MTLDQLPWSVLHALEQRGHSHEQIEQMTGEQIFHEFCEWEGLINWSAALWNTVHALSK